MNNRVAKKLRKYSKREWRKFYDEILSLPFKNRFRIGWYIMWHSNKNKAKQKIWKNRREIKKE